MAFGLDRRIHVWTVANGHLIRKIRAEDELIHALAVTPSGDFLITGGERLALRSLKTGKVVRVFGPNGDVRCTSVAVSQDGRFVLSGHREGEVKLWGARTGKLTYQFVHKGVAQAVWSVCFSPDGKLGASGGDGPVIRLWSIEEHRRNRLDLRNGP